nr:hypothetical protein CFP56_38481 [Quercus suber]
MCSHCKLRQHTTTKRKGEINHGIKVPESIADPMNRMPLMALIAADLLVGLNRERYKYFKYVIEIIIYKVEAFPKKPNEEYGTWILTHRSGDV